MSAPTPYRPPTPAEERGYGGDRCATAIQLSQWQCECGLCHWTRERIALAACMRDADRRWTELARALEHK